MNVMMSYFISATIKVLETDDDVGTMINLLLMLINFEKIHHLGGN